MQAWKNIRCRVRPVQNRDGKGKNIVPLKGCGSKQMPIGVNGGYHQKQRHSRKQKNTALIKFPLIFQLEKTNKLKLPEHTGTKADKVQ